MEHESIASRFFSPHEVSELMALQSLERELAFFHCWTRKEAYIKAHGLGLSLPLESFDVSLAPHEPAILRATRPDRQEATHWTLASPEVDSGYAAAVAVDGQGLEFRLWD
jgi:4'-phosphopantetheinyl transferase